MIMKMHTIAAFTFLYAEIRNVWRREGILTNGTLFYSVCAWRCQLPQKNPYYPEDVDSVVDDKYFDASCSYSPLHYGNHLCSVCGIKATSKCAKCNTYYCSRDHQVAAWKNGHKESCGKKASASLGDKDSVCPGVQFPHWEVEIFPEPEPTKEEALSEQKEKERLQAFASQKDELRSFAFST